MAALLGLDGNFKVLQTISQWVVHINTYWRFNFTALVAKPIHFKTICCGMCMSVWQRKGKPSTHI